MKPTSRLVLSIPLFTLEALAGVFAISIVELPSGDLLHFGRRQPSTVVVTVIDAAARYPLANADVIDLATQQHRFTDDHGQARLPWPSDGQLRLRVREVGYQPLQRTLSQNAASEEAATFALSKVAYVISSVEKTSHCVTTDDSASLALSVAVLEQLRQGAQKYDEFRRLYPFEMTFERRSAYVPENGKISRISSNIETYKSEIPPREYRPGDIVRYLNGSFSVPILFLSTLGDSVFWDHHCFIVRSVESLQDARVVRLEFSPSPDVTGPDWAGDAFIDSATSILKRVDFRVVKPNPSYSLKRLEGYTTFSSPSPYIVVPDTTGASWWTRRNPDAKGNWPQPDYVQMIYMQEMKYRKAKPPKGDK
ncbi:MAG: hypothetical protein ABI469_07530 [Gemmatimonadales bacterium]